MIVDLVDDVEALNLPLDFILTNTLERSLFLLDISERVAINQLNIFVTRCEWYYMLELISNVELNQLIAAVDLIKSEIIGA